MTQMPAESGVKPRKTALAITGEPGRQAVLTAKGYGAMAEKILDLAFANDVKVREDAALTQMLKATEVDTPIPLPALDAVCALLTHVYQVSRREAPPGWEPR
jgi:flagellar biosynthesis protein